MGRLIREALFSYQLEQWNLEEQRQRELRLKRESSTPPLSIEARILLNYIEKMNPCRTGY